MVFIPLIFKVKWFLPLVLGGPGSMTGFYLFLFVWGINPIPGVALGWIIGFSGGYLIARKLKWT